MIRTWYYTTIVVDGALQDVRCPIAIDGDVAVIDWLREEIWHEPPHRVKHQPWRTWLMRCCRCGYEKRQKCSGHCHKCGIGWMLRRCE